MRRGRQVDHPKAITVRECLGEHDVHGVVLEDTHGVWRHREQRDRKRERAEYQRQEPIGRECNRVARGSQCGNASGVLDDRHGLTGVKMAAVGSNACTLSSGGLRVESERAAITPYVVVPMTYVGL